MTKPFDPTKPCTLSDGTPVRIICTDRKGNYPIVALAPFGRYDETPIARRADGTSGSALALINTVERTVLRRWAKRTGSFAASIEKSEYYNFPVDYIYEDGVLIDVKKGE